MFVLMGRAEFRWATWQRRQAFAVYLQANYAVAEKDLRVCRPLVHVREKTLAQFAKDNRHNCLNLQVRSFFSDFPCCSRLPVIADNCPACFAAPKERHRPEPRLVRDPITYWGLLANKRT